MTATATRTEPVPALAPAGAVPGFALPASGPRALDALIPNPDIRERFSTTVRAPAAIVMQVARTIDMQSLWPVRAIIRLREILMRARPVPRASREILAETLAMGWGLLGEEPDRLVVCGAHCQPWVGDTTFTPIPAGRFAAFAEPDRVKIAWTLEAIPRGAYVTEFAHETRAAATDAAARRRFRHYWWWARFGIIAIRLLLLPAIRREAERRWVRAQAGCHA